MNALLLALLWALATLLAYLALTEQLDYASVRRRQLDAWAAVSATICLLAIVYGGLDARSQRMRGLGLAQGSEVPAAAIQRLVQPDLAWPAVAADDAFSAASEFASADEGGEDPSDGLAALPGEPEDGERDDSDADHGSGDRREAILSPGEAVDEAGAATDSLPLLPTADAPVLVAPTPTLQRVVTRAPILLTAPPPTQALVLPSLTPASRARPSEVPQPTPHCGDPGEIDMSIRITEAKVDRGGERGVVRYRAEIRNDADFPVLLSRTLVTAQDARSGSDQFGSDRRSDARIAAGHAFILEGAVTLEKYPSPLSRSELCVSFVTETCGRQPVFATTRRCQGISGF